MARCAGIVLAGGRSSRMGTPKADLDWHGLPLVVRVAGILSRSLDGPIVVVRAPHQELPSLPPRVEVVEDAREGRGPLEGIAAGLRAVATRTRAAYVSSTDAPLLHPRFVQYLAGALDGETEVVVPRSDGRAHPLAAVYRTDLLPSVEELISADRMRPAFLFETARVRWLEAADLLANPEIRNADPALASLRNLNTREEYDEAHGLPLPMVRIERYGTLRAPHTSGVGHVRAATLGRAAAAAGITLNGHVVAALNGDQISREQNLPLVEGDVISFMSADAGG